MLEDNTYATSIYIDAPISEVAAFVKDGPSLGEWTLGSRMQDQVDETTWLGTASGYQKALYYHARHRRLGGFEVVEWHCGFEPDVFHHVYPMFVFPAAYFGSTEAGTYFHWISFVDPARRTPAIAQGLPTVHRAEARSLKASLERRRGHRHAVDGALDVRSHTVYVDAPYHVARPYLADPANIAEWSYMVRLAENQLVDEYERPLTIELLPHDVQGYAVIEHATRYDDVVIQAPLAIVPAAYAFAEPRAPGILLHRITGWPVDQRRRVGKQTSDDYNAEILNTKRILEARVGNLGAYARGNSYLGLRDP